MMTEPNLELTDRVLAQGKALARAIAALETIEPSGWFERAIAGLLLLAYRRRLRGIVEAAPEWMAEEILGASQYTGSDRAMPWLSEN
jgi:hypothetical protein